MLKRFGYTNLMMLAICTYFLYGTIDVEQPSIYNKLFYVLYGILLLIHFVRVILIIIKIKRG